MISPGGRGWLIQAPSDPHSCAPDEGLHSAARPAVTSFEREMLGNPALLQDLFWLHLLVRALTRSIFANRLGPAGFEQQGQQLGLTLWAKGSLTV